MMRDDAGPLRIDGLGPDLVLVDRSTGREIPVELRRRARRRLDAETLASIRARDARLEARFAAEDAAAAEAARGSR
ncbi:hypothetical protein [Cellulomonas pakistanensis]|uniref:Uncharacterized protein n=1 Tax=Cellulomonas pakistanensis TaxID=992287 RepID=A0A919P831_9CELL|nr:hypothetical protein [Cellulomonas pakistanensis]GIG35796.1 hypothetical protein Cpa01nite_11770 [Cellulomonas pakistanensis]